MTVLREREREDEEAAGACRRVDGDPLCQRWGLNKRMPDRIGSGDGRRPLCLKSRWSYVVSLDGSQDHKHVMG